MPLALPRSLRIQRLSSGISSQWRRLTVLSVMSICRDSRPIRVTGVGQLVSAALVGPCRTSSVSTAS